MSHLDDDKKKK